MNNNLKRYIEITRQSKLTDFQINFSGLKLGNHRFDFKIEDSFFQLFDYAELNSGQINATILLKKKSNK